MADLAAALRRELPYVRRYARAITGSQTLGDESVRQLLENLLRSSGRDQDGELGQLSGHALRRILLRRLQQIWDQSDNAHSVDADPTAASAVRGVLGGSAILARRVTGLPTIERQVLVLTALEKMSLADTAEILSLTIDEAAEQLRLAKADLRAQPATRILIIEDEPVIALDLAGMLERNGHDIVGIAATRTEAVKLAAERRPGLILADIQLADDSSGIDAVQDILAHLESEHSSVPVIFVTAFPERLLTGERPEPTFLVTKPFDADTLDVTISQALATTGRARAA